MIATDIDAFTISKLKQFYKKNVTFRVSDLKKEAFKNIPLAYDTVIASGVFYLFDDKELLRIISALKRHGFRNLIIVSRTYLPQKPFLYGIAKHMKTRLTHFFTRFHPRAKLYGYSRQTPDYRNLLKRLELSIEKSLIYPFDRGTILYWVKLK